MRPLRSRKVAWAAAAACAVGLSLPATGAGATTPSGVAGAGQQCNGAWQSAPTKGLPSSFNAWEVKVFGANDVVLSGAYDSKNDEAAIARWNGARWTMSRIPGGFYGGHLAGTSSADLFVETTASSGDSMIAHLHAGKWSMIPESTAFGGPQGAINGMVSTKPGDLWAVGPRFTSVGATAIVTHYTSGTWHTVANNLATTPWSVPISLTVSPKGELWLTGEDITSTAQDPTVRIPYAGKLVGNTMRRVELPSVPGQPSTMPENINWSSNGTMVVSGWTGSDSTSVAYPYSSSKSPNGGWKMQSRPALTTGNVYHNVSARIGPDVWSADENGLIDKEWTGLATWQGDHWSRLRSLSAFAGYAPGAMDGDKRGDGWMVGVDQNYASHQWRICGSPRTGAAASGSSDGASVAVGKRPATTSVGPRAPRAQSRPTSHPMSGPYDGLAPTSAHKASPGRALRNGKALNGPAITRLRKAQPAAAAATNYVAMDACAEPRSAHTMRCQAKVVATRTGPKVRAAAAGVPAGYGPADFRAAYRLPKTGGKGRTVAVVAAYGYPTLAKDLAAYRKATGLPACTVAAKCLTITGQDGGKPPAEVDQGWALEQALDVQAVSAACPDCKIRVVQAKSPSDDDLGAANLQAAEGKPFVINDSFGRVELSTDRATASSMVPKGIPLVASTGDFGLQTGYPSTVPSVVGVGGTTLLQTPGTKRGWSEHLWSLSGGGCSAVQQKPAFQKQSFCLAGTSSSVAVVADADPASGAAVYDSTGFQGQQGWFVVGGTSLASPLTAGMYAVRGIKPSVAQLWSGARTTNPVTGGGSNGWCTPKIECTARANNYSGASGWGSLAR
jgi:hypothetical protein